MNIYERMDWLFFAHCTGLIVCDDDDAFFEGRTSEHMNPVHDFGTVYEA